MVKSKAENRKENGTAAPVAVKRKRNVAMLAAAVLMCLVLASTYMVSDMLAKFASTDGNEDTARVASFSVGGSAFDGSVNLSLTMNPGDVQNFTSANSKALTITNNSEVSVSYTVNIRKTTDNLPLQFKVGASGSQTDQTSAFTSAQGYTSTASLAPNGGTFTLEFALEWPNTPAANTDPVLSGQLDNIAVTVTAVQID